MGRYKDSYDNQLRSVVNAALGRLKNTKVVVLRHHLFGVPLPANRLFRGRTLIEDDMSVSVVKHEGSRRIETTYFSGQISEKITCHLIYEGMLQGRSHGDWVPEKDPEEKFLEKGFKDEIWLSRFHRVSIEVRGIKDSEIDFIASFLPRGQEVGRR